MNNKIKIKIKLKLQLLKFKNSGVLYITPKLQYWSITSLGIKTCIAKNIKDLSYFQDIFKTKNWISYQDSLKIKKSTNFNIYKTYILIIFKTKNITIHFLKPPANKLISNNLEFSNLSLNLNNNLDITTKKNYGIFFTSQKLIHIILNRLNIILTKLKMKLTTVLEPSVGSGEILLGLDKYFSNLNILGIEYNTNIYNKIKNFSLVDNSLVIKKKDFLKLSTNVKFDLIISNPPFKIIKKSLVTNYNTFFPNKVNIYGLFILHSLKLLTDNGLLVIILPKSFLNSMSYNNIRYHIKNNYTIIDLIDNLSGDYFLGTSIEISVLFLQKKISNSNNFFIKFGNYLTFSSHYNYLNKLLSEGTNLKDLGFEITVGSVLKANKPININNIGMERGYFISDSNIQNNKLSLNSNSIIYSDSLNYGICIIVFRGYGNIKFKFKYAIINIDEGYLIENHLLIIKHTCKFKLVDLINKFQNKKFLNFINLYFSNQSLNIKELFLCPIF